MKNQNLTERLCFVTTPENKKEIEGEAKRRGIKTPEYLRQCVDFHASFDSDFLAQVQPVADEMKVPLATLIQNLIMAYMATERAAMDVFGVQPKTFQRAFQFDGTSLITSGKLSDIVYDQAKKDAETVRKRLEEGVRDNKAVRIDTAQAAFVAAHVSAAHAG